MQWGPNAESGKFLVSLPAVALVVSFEHFPFAQSQDSLGRQVRVTVWLKAYGTEYLLRDQHLGPSSGLRHL